MTPVLIYHDWLQGPSHQGTYTMLGQAFPFSSLTPESGAGQAFSGTIEKFPVLTAPFLHRTAVVFIPPTRQDPQSILSGTARSNTENQTPERAKAAD